MLLQLGLLGWRYAHIYDTYTERCDEKLNVGINDDVDDTLFRIPGYRIHWRLAVLSCRTGNVTIRNDSVPCVTVEMEEHHSLHHIRYILEHHLPSGRPDPVNISDAFRIENIGQYVNFEDIYEITGGSSSCTLVRL